MQQPSERNNEQFGADVRLDRPAYIDPTVRLYGQVSVAEGASLWPYAVARAETQQVTIGRFSNIQDHAVLHVGYLGPTKIGDYCSITHQATVHCAVIGNNTLIGINATLMDGVVVGENCIIAGGSFLKEGTVIPDNSIVMGTPGKIVKQRNNFRQNRQNALMYHYNAQSYARGQHRAWTGPAFERWREQMLAEVDAAFAQLYPQSQASQ